MTEDQRDDPFRHDDAAYVLGALDESERLAFEMHLESCPECRARVAELRPTVAALGGVTIAQLEADVPVPDTLLPGLLRRARGERRRRRWLTSALAATAAACLAALVVVLWPTSPSGPDPRAFAALRPSPVSATAQLVSRAWGTEIDLHCRYAQGFDAYVPYRLVVIDKNQHHYAAGSWTLVPGRVTDFTGGTSVSREHIDRVQITLTDGTPILQLKP